MAWASVRPSVILLYCVKTMQAEITKSLPWAASRSLVFRDKILCPWLREFLNESDKEEYPPPLVKKDIILPLLARIV